MGLDYMELCLRLEDRYAIRLDDEYPIRTVGDLYECLLQRLQFRGSRCPTPGVFVRLRRYFVNQGIAPCRRLPLGAKLESLNITAPSWNAVTCETGLKLPPLRRRWFFTLTHGCVFCAWVLVVISGMFVGLALVAEPKNGIPMLGSYLLSVAAVVLFHVVEVWLGKRFSRLPRELRTFGDLVQAATRETYPTMPSHRVDPGRVWLELSDEIVAVGDVERSRVTYDARIYEDLGMG